MPVQVRQTHLLKCVAAIAAAAQHQKPPNTCAHGYSSMRSRAHLQSWTPPPWLLPSWQQQAWQAPHRLKTLQMSCHPHQQLLQQQGKEFREEGIGQEQTSTVFNRAWACPQKQPLRSVGPTSLSKQKGPWVSTGNESGSPCSALSARHTKLTYSTVDKSSKASRHLGGSDSCSG